jgi:hypothetical protein
MKGAFNEVINTLKVFCIAICKALEVGVKQGINAFNEEIKKLKDDIEDR